MDFKGNRVDGPLTYRLTAGLLQCHFDQPS